VAYLNGSKVLTTGSALTFDGTNLDLATVGAKLNFATTGSATRNYVGVSADGYSLEMVMQRGASQPISYKQDFSAAAHIYSIAGSEQMRLTSTGLGIGTSSPAAKLHVNGAARIQSDLELADSGNTVRGYIFGTSGGVTYRATSGLPHIWQNVGTELMRLDSSGNLGLGVTPSAWQSGAKAIEIGGNAYLAFTGSTNGGYLYNNAYLSTSGTNTYKASGFASALGIGPSGEFRFFTAPSGTAGNAISFTQAMTLDSSGNLLVGTTTSAYSAAGRGLIELNGSSDSLFAFKRNNTNNFYIQNASDAVYFQNTANTAIIFSTNNSERARITSGGNLLIGTTTTLINFSKNINLSDGTNTCEFDPDRIYFNASSYYVLNTSATGVKLDNGTTAWAAQSDERTKDIIEPITNAVQKVAGLRAVIGKYKTDAEGVRRSFLIAQDVQAVLPEAVSADKQDGMLSIRYTEVIPLLTAAIKEQQALINDLRARVAQLEAK